MGVARTPPGSRKWGDAMVTLWTEREYALSARVKQDRPVTALAAAASGRRVTLSVQPGVPGGPNGVVEIALAVIERP